MPQFLHYISVYFEVDDGYRCISVESILFALKIFSGISTDYSDESTVCLFAVNVGPKGCLQAVCK